MRPDVGNALTLLCDIEEPGWTDIRISGNHLEQVVYALDIDGRVTLTSGQHLAEDLR